MYCAEWILSSCGKKECCYECDIKGCLERCKGLSSEKYMTCGSFEKMTKGVKNEE